MTIHQTLPRPVAQTAPDFPHYKTGQPTTYPSGGKHIGPAWQWIWDRLDNGPVDYMTIRNHVLAHHDLQETTLKNLLAQARNVGLIRMTNERLWERRTIRKPMP